MSALRDIKARARGDLHRTMSVPALYFSTPEAAHLDVTVRLHTKDGALGKLQGMDPATRVEVSPKIIFLLSEVSPITNSVVKILAAESFSGADEHYRIKTTQPPDGITVEAEVTLMSAAQVQKAFQ